MSELAELEPTDSNLRNPDNFVLIDLGTKMSSTYYRCSSPSPPPTPTLMDWTGTVEDWSQWGRPSPDAVGRISSDQLLSRVIIALEAYHKRLPHARNISRRSQQLALRKQNLEPGSGLFLLEYFFPLSFSLVPLPCLFVN